MKVFIEQTDERTPPRWEQVNWHNVERNVRRIQERILRLRSGQVYRATERQEWKAVQSLQKLLARATSNKFLAIRRVTQENQGKHTPGVAGRVYDTPEARLALLVVQMKQRTTGLFIRTVTIRPTNDKAIKCSRLEPCEGRLSRTVLRGPGRSNAARLPGDRFHEFTRKIKNNLCNSWQRRKLVKIRVIRGKKEVCVKRALVCGAGGFIGGHRLRQGDKGTGRQGEEGLSEKRLTSGRSKEIGE